MSMRNQYDKLLAAYIGAADAGDAEAMTLSCTLRMR